MPKIDLKTAVKSARRYVDDIKEYLGNNPDNLLIEEIELSEDNKFWLITIGFDRLIPPKKIKNPLEIEPLFKDPIERVYKTFEVDSETGKVKSMKMYKS